MTKFYTIDTANNGPSDAGFTQLIDNVPAGTTFLPSF